MYKKVLLTILLICLTNHPCVAEKIYFAIAPIQVISTNNDDVEVGDLIKFEIVNDVYKENSLYLKKGTNVIGMVEYVHPNGLLGDAADIKIKNFKTVDVNNKKVEIICPININGNKFVNKNTKEYFFFVSSIFTRGHEIYIEPDTQTFNIFIER